MAVSSPSPMRRARTSSLPAAVSKAHWPDAVCFNGMGKGKLSAPMYRIWLPARFLLQRFIWLYPVTKRCALFLSFTASPEKRTSLPSGPKIAISASWSPFLAASKSAAPAAAGEAKVFWAPVADSDFSAPLVSRFLHATNEAPSASASTSVSIKRRVDQSLFLYSVAADIPISQFPNFLVCHSQ